MSASWYEQQIKNNNYLSPIGFKFSIQKAPKTSYLCQSTNIPDITVGDVSIPTPFIRYPIEGNFQYGNFDMQFLVDENLENYLEIHNWMRALGVPYDFDERREFENATSIKNERNIFSDGTLEVYTNNLTSNFHVVFINMFPVSLSTLEFDATVGDNNFMSARVSFKYAYYELRTPKGERKTLSNWNPEGL